MDNWYFSTKSERHGESNNQSEWYSLNLSEWLYICSSSSIDDLEPLTTLIAPLAIIPRLKT